MKLYACFDRVAGEFGFPNPQKNDGVAKRNYYFGLSQRGITPADFSDFGLFCLGSFDPETGKLDSLPNPEEVITHVSEWLKTPPGSASNKKDRKDLA